MIQDPMFGTFPTSLLGDAMGASALAFILVDARADDYPVVFASAAFCSLTGYDEEEVLGRNCRFLHGEDREQPGLEDIRNALKQRCGCQTVLRNYRKDGTLFWNRVRIEPVWAGGEVTYYVGIQEDVSESLAAREELVLVRDRLEQSISRLKLAQSIGRLGYWEYDIAADSLIWSDDVYTIFAVPLGELTPTYDGFLKFVHPDDRERIQAEFSRALEENRPYETIHRIVTGEKQVKYVKEKCDVIRDSKNVPIKTFGIVADVTEFCEQQQELKRLFDTMEQGVIYQDSKGRVIKANEAAKGILFGVGSSCDSSLDYLSAFETLYDEEGRVLKGSSHPSVRALLSGEVVKKNNVRLRRECGKDVWLNVSAFPVDDSFDSTRFVFSIISDISVERDLEEKIKKKEGIRRLLVGISKTMINAPVSEYGNIINDSLKRIGMEFYADRAFVFKYSDDFKVTNNTHEWCAQGIDSQIENLQDSPLEGMESWLDMHRSGKSVFIPDVQSLDEMDAVRKILEPQGIKSILAVPMIHENVCLGFVGLDYVRNYHSFDEEEVELFETFAECIVNFENRIKFYSELDYNRQLVNDIVKSSGYAIFVKDVQGRYRVVNEIWKEIHSLEKVDVIGKIDNELFKKETVSRWSREDYIIISSGESIKFEELLKAKKGNSYLLTTKFPMYDKEGNFIGIAGSSIDVTDIKVSEELETLRSEISETFVNSGGLGWCVGRVVDFVQRYCGGILIEFLVRADADSSQFTFISSSSDSKDAGYGERFDFNRFREDHRSSLLNGVEIKISSSMLTDEELARVSATPLGEVDIGVIPVVSLSGNLTGLMFLIVSENSNFSFRHRDSVIRGAVGAFAYAMELDGMRELRQSEQNAQAAMEARSAFLAKMSHEIRTPIHAILGFSKLAHDRIDHSEEVKKYITRITKNADHLSAMLEDILVFSRMDKTPSELIYSYFNLRELFDEIVHTYEDRAVTQHVIFESLIPKGLSVEVLGDKTKIQQIIVNLLNNAFKFSEKGQVTLSVSGVSGARESGANNNMIEVLFSVTDTGVGIPEDEIESIFQDFYVGREGKKKGGTGLGLTIVKRYLELMGGTIEAKNCSSGGVKFSVGLPLKLRNPTVVSSSISLFPREDQSVGPERSEKSALSEINYEYEAGSLPEDELKELQYCLEMGLTSRLRKLTSSWDSKGYSWLDYVYHLLEQYDYDSIRKFFRLNISN